MSALLGFGERLARAVYRTWWMRRPAPLNWALWPVSVLYRVLAHRHRIQGLRAAARDVAVGPGQPRGPAESSGAQSTRFGRPPTLVVGNWVVGGAGKTPTTQTIIRHLQERGWHPGIVTRGYGRSAQVADAAPRLVNPWLDRADQVGDEPLQMARSTGVPVCVHPDRRAAREFLLQKSPGVDVVISDDGLQHRSLHRDIEVVVVDERGAGNGLCLPAGPLREPIPRELGPHMLVVYSGGHPTLALEGYTAQRRLAAPQPYADWAAGGHAAEEKHWETLRRSPALHAIAGIAVPERFFGLLKDRGLALIEHPLPDHALLTDCPWPPDAADVVMTEKDAVKVGPWADSGPRLWVARLDFTIEPGFWEALDTQLDGWRKRAPGQETSQHGSQTA